MKLTFKKLIKFSLLLFIVFTTGILNAQSPTITSFTPTRVTKRTVVTVNGTNFTAATTVTFGETAASNVTIISANKLLATVNEGSSGSVKVINNSGSFSKSGLVYVAPVTPSGAAVSRIITDWNNYWSSTAASTTASQQPDTHHNLLAFRYGTTTYSTGVNNSALNNNGVNYTPGDFRALPVSSISGNTSASNFISLGNKIDGNAAAADYLSPAVTGLTVQDVLIDGTKGLGLGSGVTNINGSAVLLFNVNTITSSQITDSQPDILITQTADATENAYDIFCFIDSNGDIIGTPVQANFYNTSSIGTYKVDLFTLAAGAPYATVTPSGNGAAGGNTRDIRMVAFQLSDFGLTSTTANNVDVLKYMPSGTSDPAFMAYNAGAITIPAPVITQQPSSVAICPGIGTATFTVTATGTGLSYQWRKNTVNIPGATSASYTIPNPQETDVAAYSVVVTNASGSVMSNIVYLNTIISLQPENASVCIGTPHTISFTSNGASLTYQWYSKASPGNTGGTLISGATSSTYSPPVNIAGTKYYYCVITNNGSGCAGATTNAIAFTVYPASVAGTTSSNTTICTGSSTTISLSGYTGSIQWQLSLNNSTWTDINGATAASFTTPNLTQTTYYRARITSGSCSASTSSVITVTITSAPIAGTAAGGQNVCLGTTAQLTLTGYSGTIQWQQSGNGADGWANVTGGNNPTGALYTTPAITEPTYYRAVVTKAGCEVISNTINIGIRSIIWTGATDSNWHTAANWNCNTIPGETDTVIIPNTQNDPIISSSIQALAKTLTIEDNAALTVNSGSSIAVTNTITVATAGSFTLQDDANLIQVDNVPNTGNITLHKNSSKLFKLDYTLWSTPVTGQELHDFSPLTLTAPESRFYVYSTASSSYASVNPFGTNFDVAKGYIIRMPNEDSTPGYNEGQTSIIFEGVFTGNPNNGTITAPLSTADLRYNAIGNPYPSPISVRDFFLANAGALAPGEPLFFWRKKNNANATSYAILTLGGFVANIAVGGNPGEDQFGGGQWASYFNSLLNTEWVIKQGQAFIVKAAQGATQAVFTNSMRRDRHNTAFFRTNENPMSRFWLNMTGAEGEFAQTAIVYTQEGTLGIDYGWDGKRMPSANMSLYSIESTTTFAIQARPEFDVTDIVPMGFTAEHAGTYTIELGQTDGAFAEGQKVYLKDSVAELIHNMMEGSYTFETEAGTFNERFKVVYMSGDGLSINNVTGADTFTVVKKDNNLHINTGSVHIAGVRIYDTRGRLIYEVNNINSASAVIENLPAEQQVLLVQVTTTENMVLSKKIVY